MPAIMTHDFFGKDAYSRLAHTIGSGQQQQFAFLLGNQGPDPLFYSVGNPTIKQFSKFGSTMHAIKTDELLVAFKEALMQLPDEERPLGRAYLLGFLCHYLLDSAVHPLVYANQYALCDAGVEGLTRKDGSEVHGVIESEFDEVLLYTRTGQTVATYAPEKEILRADDKTLNIIGKLYSYMAPRVFDVEMPADAFRKSVKCFRFIQGIFHSRSGRKRELIARIEELVRPYSFYRSMAHRAVQITECAYDNHEGATWVNPFTQETCSASFNQLFQSAQDKIEATFALFDNPNFNLETAHEITQGKNFSGNPGQDESDE